MPRVRLPRKAFQRGWCLGSKEFKNRMLELIQDHLGENHSAEMRRETAELVKGTAELVCLHGLNTLSDHTYRRVIEIADRVDHEPWMLQSGGELWRRLLAAAPGHCSIAHVLMHLARLVERLESKIGNAIEGVESPLCQLAEVHGSDDRR